MRDGRLFFSAVQFCIIAALFAGGAAFFLLNHSLAAREMLSEWIVNAKSNFFLIGTLLTGLASLLTICFWAMQKGSFIKVKMGGFTLREPLVKQAVMTFWSEEFPEELAPSEVYLRKSQVEVIVEDRDQDLEEIERKLEGLLNVQLGLNEPFFVTLTKR